MCTTLTRAQRAAYTVGYDGQIHYMLIEQHAESNCSPITWHPRVTAFGAINQISDWLDESVACVSQGVTSSPQHGSTAAYAATWVDALAHPYKLDECTMALLDGPKTNGLGLVERACAAGVTMDRMAGGGLAFNVADHPGFLQDLLGGQDGIPAWRLGLTHPRTDKAPTDALGAFADLSDPAGKREREHLIQRCHKEGLIRVDGLRIGTQHGRTGPLLRLRLGRDDDHATVLYGNIGDTTALLARNYRKALACLDADFGASPGTVNFSLLPSLIAATENLTYEVLKRRERFPIIDSQDCGLSDRAFGFLNDESVSDPWFRISAFCEQALEELNRSGKPTISLVTTETQA